MRKTILAICILAAASSFAAAEELNGYSHFSGKYKIGGKTVLDPPPDEKNDRVYLEFDAKASKAMYDSMPSKPTPSACSDDILEKYAGGLMCLKHGSDYSCTVAITLSSGKTANASVC
jgi:hypothetical protein